MYDNDEEELRQAIDKYTNAIRAERRAVDQGDSAEVDQGDSTMSDHGDRELLGARDLEALTGTKASTWRYWASIGEGPASFKLGRRRARVTGRCRNDRYAVPSASASTVCTLVAPVPSISAGYPFVGCGGPAELIQFVNDGRWCLIASD
jgi:hypothetical protein